MSELPPDTLAAFDTLRQTRQSLVALVESLPDDARTTVPDGFNNHVLWNAGHLAATEQALVYSLTGLPPNVSPEFVGAFRKGTSPRDWDRAWTWDEVRDKLLTLPDLTRADAEAGRFDDRPFREYTTTPGVTLRSVSDAVQFNLYHEGIHLGAILALRKLIG